MSTKSIKRMVNRLHDVAVAANGNQPSVLFELEFCRRSIVDFLDSVPEHHDRYQELIDKFFGEPLTQRNIKSLLEEHEILLIKGMIGDQCSE